MVTARRLFASVVATLSMSVVLVLAADQDKSQPKHSIKEIMVNAHKAGLLEKVVKGDASPDEKLVLLDHYVSLAENKPPKGSAESWQEKTNAIVLAAAKVAVGRDGSAMLLKNATDCAACHKLHK